MRRGVVVIVVAWAALAWGKGGHDLTDQELQTEIARNRTLAAYVGRNGMPDVAESRFLSDEPPWDDQEVTLYYLGMRKEIGFARAWILGQPTIQIERYEHPLTDAQVAALSKRARRYGTGVSRTAGGTGVPADRRAEAAAQRAEAAAAHVETAALAAERAADRTEAVTAKMERAFHSALRK